MSDVRVTLDSVEVTDGQGAGEGNFEPRIQVLEAIPLQGNLTKVIWPSLNTTEEVNNNGTIRPINQVVDTYRIGSKKVTKNFLILVEEEDTGTLGQDEFGQASLDLNSRPACAERRGPR